MTSSGPARVRGRGQPHRETRPPAGETANKGNANLNGGNPAIASGDNHVIVAATFVDGSGWVILDAYV